MNANTETPAVSLPTVSENETPFEPAPKPARKRAPKKPAAKTKPKKPAKKAPKRKAKAPARKAPAKKRVAGKRPPHKRGPHGNPPHKVARHGEAGYGRKVAAARKAKGWAQWQLAEKLGITQPAVCNVEKGTVKAGLDLKARLRKVLKVK